MSLEFVAILITLLIGVFGLYTKVHQDGNTERLNPVGKVLLVLLIVSAGFAYQITGNKQRELERFQADVRSLQQQLKSEGDAANRVKSEREALEREIDHLKAAAIDMRSDVPYRIDAQLGTGEWVGDTVTLKLYEAQPAHAITRGFSGTSFSGKDAVFQVSVVNVDPADMKKITFGGICYVGLGLYPRCGPFRHGQEITLSTHTDSEGTYGVMINESEADKTALSVILKSNPDAGIQLRLIRTIDVR